MKLRIHVFIVLLFVTLSNCVNAEVANPYNLVTDAELDSSWSAIETNWELGEDGSFQGVDNIVIKYKIFRHPDEVGAIVISSGRTETYIKYKELIYNLGRSGYTVYIHDHRGQGFSDRMTESNKPEDLQKGHVWDFGDYVTDLKTFYDLEISPNKHNKLYLLAHSMGGGIATLYIEKYQNDFKAAALSSPMHQPDTGILKGAACTGADFTTTIRDFFVYLFGWEPRYAVGQAHYKKVAFTPNTPDIMTHDEKRFLEIQKLYDEHDEVKIGGITSHWLAASCDASEKLLENATSVKIPVLVLQAEKDIAVTAKGQNTFCDNLASAGVTMCESGKPIVIPGAYHEMFIESDDFRIPAITEILLFFEKYSSK